MLLNLASYPLRSFLRRLSNFWCDWQNSREPDHLFISLSGEHIQQEQAAIHSFQVSCLGIEGTTLLFIWKLIVNIPVKISLKQDSAQWRNRRFLPLNEHTYECLMGILMGAGIGFCYVLYIFTNTTFVSAFHFTLFKNASPSFYLSYNFEATS